VKLLIFQHDHLASFARWETFAPKNTAKQRSRKRHGGKIQWWIVCYRKFQANTTTVPL